MTLRILCFLVLCSTVGQAATYYVDPATGSDANPGTAQGSPWQHIPGTVGGGPTTVINNGDVINVKGGSVINASIAIVSSNYNGSASYNSIIIQSGELLGSPWGSGKVVLDEQNTRFYGVGFDNVSGVTLDDFEIRNIAAGVNSWGGNSSACVELGANSTIGFSFVTIRRCYLHDAIRSGVDQGHGCESDHGHDLLIYYNTIGPGIGTKGIEPFHVQGGAISNNFIAGTGDHGIALSAATNIDVAANVIMATTNGVHNPTYCIALPGSKNCDVWNNVVYQQPGLTFVAGNDWKMGIGLYAQVTTISTGHRIINNTVAYLKAQGNGGASTAVAFGGNDIGAVTNVIFENNLVISCTNNPPGNVDFLFFGDPNDASHGWTTNDTITFNSLFTQDTSQTCIGKFSGGAYTYYLVSAFPTSAGTTYANNQELDPKFNGGVLPTGLNANFQPNQGYFALSLSTPATIKSTANTFSGDAVHGYSSAAGKFNLDIVGTLRSGWSMGAYEFGQGTWELKGMFFWGQQPLTTPARLNARYWWAFEDNPTNVNVTNWLDRIVQFPVTNSNNSLRPTNSSNGVGYNGSTWLTNINPFAITSGGAGNQNVVSNGSLWVVISPQSTALSGIVTSSSGGGRGLFTVATRQFEWFSPSGNVIFDTSFTVGTPIDIGISVTNGAVCSFYTNGVLAVAATSGDSDNASGQLNIGSYGSLGGTSPFNGKVLDVAYFTNYLTAAQYALLHVYAKSRGVSP